MKKINMVAALATLALSSFALAAGPTWNCELQTTRLSGVSAAFGPAISLAGGRGNVHCVASDNSGVSDTAVAIHLLGGGVGIGISYIKELDIRIVAAGLSAPQDMFGNLKLEGNVSLDLLNRGEQAGSFIAVSGTGASLGVELTGYRGFGLEANAEVQGIAINAQ